MKAAVCRWGALVAVICCAGAARVDAQVAVTDQDRVFRNFTREAATVNPGQVRVEIRGLRVSDEEQTRLDTLGFPVDDLEEELTRKRGIDYDNSDQRVEVDGVNGATIDLLASYGLGSKAEVGFDVPFIIQETKLEFDPDITMPGHTTNLKDITDESIGDVLFYGKLKHAVAEHCKMSAGLELTAPTGSESKRLGTGEVSVNPFVASRYQRGRFAIGGHAGYQIYSNDYPDIFNYSVEAIVRGGASYAFRAELSGRLFKIGGTQYHDVVVLPGIDFNLSNNFIIRPTGLANVTDEAMDWGIGLGIAFQM